MRAYIALPSKALMVIISSHAQGLPPQETKHIPEGIEKQLIASLAFIMTRRYMPRSISGRFSLVPCNCRHIVATLTVELPYSASCPKVALVSAMRSLAAHLNHGVSRIAATLPAGTTQKLDYAADY